MTNRKFSVNSKNYTKKHNDIMDDLLFSYACHSGRINVCNDDTYIPLDATGLEVLDYLKNLDLIEEVIDKP